MRHKFDFSEIKPGGERTHDQPGVSAVCTRPTDRG